MALGAARRAVSLLVAALVLVGALGGCPLMRTLAGSAPHPAGAASTVAARSVPAAVRTAPAAGRPCSGPVARSLLQRAGWHHRPFARGAIALLLDARAGAAFEELPLDLLPSHEHGPIGHLALRERFASVL